MSLEPRFYVHINHSEILLSVKSVLTFLPNTVLGHGLLCLPTQAHSPKGEAIGRDSQDDATLSILDLPVF